MRTVTAASAAWLICKFSFPDRQQCPCLHGRSLPANSCWNLDVHQRLCPTRYLALRAGLVYLSSFGECSSSTPDCSYVKGWSGRARELRHGAKDVLRILSYSFHCFLIRNLILPACRISSVGFQKSTSFVLVNIPECRATLLSDPGPRLLNFGARPM